MSAGKLNFIKLLKLYNLHSVPIKLTESLHWTHFLIYAEVSNVPEEYMFYTFQFGFFSALYRSLLEVVCYDQLIWWSTDN